MDILTFPRPDDMHLHVRDGAALAAVVPFSARQMARAVVMPNLKPPLVSVQAASAYRQRILDAVPAGCDFTPLMTLYLTDNTLPETVQAAHEAGIAAFKLYPAGATTHSENGVTDIFRLLPVLRTMAECKMPLLVHGEVTDAAVDIFDREAVFIGRILKPLMQRLPELKIVLEHITTAEAVRFLEEAGPNLGATLTPQHLLLNRNDILAGGIRPHHYCLPVIKRESHRQALLEALSGRAAPRLFLGTDSAPHAQNAKECACGCAGIFSAHCALELYAQAFDEAGALDRLPDFAARNGARFYGLPENGGTVTLVRRPQEIPAELPYGTEKLVPFFAGRSTTWTLAGQ